MRAHPLGSWEAFVFIYFQHVFCPLKDISCSRGSVVDIKKKCPNLGCDINVLKICVMGPLSQKKKKNCLIIDYDH